MKLLHGILTSIFLTAALWAQAATPAPNPPQAPPPPPEHMMHHPMNPDAMMAMHQKHMDEMKAQVDKMKATLDQMKTNLAKVKDATVKQQMQLNVDLWETMVGHMEGMLKSMDHNPEMMGTMGGRRMHHMDADHGGMGCFAGMDHRSMKDGCCGDMKDGKSCCGGGQCGKPNAPMMEDKAPPVKN